MNELFDTALVTVGLALIAFAVYLILDVALWARDPERRLFLERLARWWYS